MQNCQLANIFGETYGVTKCGSGTRKNSGDHDFEFDTLDDHLEMIFLIVSECQTIRVRHGRRERNAASVCAAGRANP